MAQILKLETFNHGPIWVYFGPGFTWRYATHQKDCTAIVTPGGQEIARVQELPEVIAAMLGYGCAV